MKLSTTGSCSALLAQQHTPNTASHLNIKRIRNLPLDKQNHFKKHHMPTLLKIEIRQSGDRMHAIRAGFSGKDPYENNQCSQIVRSLTTSQAPSRYISVSNQKRIGSGKMHSLGQLTLREIPTSIASNIGEYLEAKPVLKGTAINLPDNSIDHTMNVSAYLANRLPSGLVDLINKSGAEFFLFNSSDQDIAAHYKNTGFDKCYKISSPTSTRFYVVKNHQTNEDKIVVSGIGSHTRLEHQILQFHFAGVDVAKKLTSIGNIDDLKTSSLTILKSQLDLIQAEDKILYIGARWKVMESIANQEFELSGDNEGEGYKKLNPANHKIGPFIFDSAKLNKRGKSIAVAALRMPNGELSYDAVKTFADSGFTKIIMCGAGGRIIGDAQMGDYIYLTHSSYKDSNVNISSNTNIIIPNDFSHINTASCTNTTVDSPLVETKQWLSQQQEANVGSVDVETAHIFRAVNDSIHPITIVPGMFVSDVVGEHPLEDKISGNGADKYISEFVKITWNALFQLEK
ncbi:hypothetical protein [Vibrio pectenicida]|uniref:Nucleoside phosphorylase domain-containing protein n=1 Tax=Vibrio pectenicida TaxID=62763 RepID=A0A3R9EKI6_9VIBR|nr:hypothetical protein [Vibrio pectenicida]RSD32539.1 hypothetical protein EJA03_02925 [Vibrio pectenicida]